jgi:hypothetical protein
MRDRTAPSTTKPDGDGRAERDDPQREQSCILRRRGVLSSTRKSMVVRPRTAPQPESCERWWLRCGLRHRVGTMQGEKPRKLHGTGLTANHRGRYRR